MSRRILLVVLGIIILLVAYARSPQMHSALAGTTPFVINLGPTETQTPVPSAGVRTAPAEQSSTSTPGPVATATARPAPTQPGLTSTPLLSAATTVPPSLPSFSHVFVIVMENKESGLIIGNNAAPYINSLAQQYGYAADSYAVSHPSLPNYLALTGGSTFGITSDCLNCFVSGSNIADQIEKGGRTWKAYIESMPEPCYLGADTSLYTRRHNPFIYYDSIRNNAARCKNTVPLSQLAIDLFTQSVPDFVWITPNLCNDMHNCPVATGDNWLHTWVPRILASPAWKDNGVLFITFDEGTTNAGCCQYAAGGKISTLVISKLVRPGFVSQVPYDHYSLLRTIEDAWGLPFSTRPYHV